MPYREDGEIIFSIWDFARWYACKDAGFEPAIYEQEESTHHG